MSEGTKIRILPPQVANKIAAGEVVDRPASVVRELVENALDAGAAQINIEITAGGKKLVSVSDNGSGMSRDDALLSLERHSTSKIRDVDDIERISTLGFRGEALAAIASVSRLRMVTRQAETLAGIEIRMTGGILEDVRETGCPQGTLVEVRDLFFNVPARRKFLRSYQTEMSHVRDTFMVQALSHPAVGMTLKVDGRETYRCVATGLCEEKIRDLFGPDYLRNLCKVSFNNGKIAVDGYVSMPVYSRGDRNEQHVFINGRGTWAAVLNYAINEGYHSILPADRHPAVFLYISMDPALVDVNVHPAKKEVRFREPSEVRDAVIAAIRGGLARAGNRVFTGQTQVVAGSTQDTAQRPKALTQLIIEDLPETRVFKYPGIRPEAEHATALAQAPGIVGAGSARREDGGGDTEDAVSAPWTLCKVVGQIGGLYVLLETEDGYVVMDPHAAHERILFEKFMAQVLERKVPTQGLLIPETVDLAPRDAVVLRDNLGVIKEMGFGVSEFGGDSFVVDALPACFTGASAKGLLLEVSRNLEAAGSRGGKGRWREESIAQAACKASVKARDKLTLSEIEQLVIDLARTEMPYTCPHGRPTIIYTSFSELNRKFGRE